MTHRAAPLLLLALLLAGCGGAETTTQPLLAPTAPPPEEAPAGARPALHYDCAGEGSPTVILEAGLGSGSGDWQAMQQRLAGLTRTCRYDRAGLEHSPAVQAEERRTSAVQVAELEALLEGAGIDPPYVLVGHSYGGSLARLFASSRPDAVTGVVLVDANHPDERERYLAALPRGEDPFVAALREQLTVLDDPSRNPERLDWEASMDEVRQAHPEEDLPLVVVTAGRQRPTTASGISQELARELNAVRLELQSDLARLTENSIHVVASASGHAVPDPVSGQPDVIVGAVEAVVHAAREDAPLPSCEEVFAGPRTRCPDAD